MFFWRNTRCRGFACKRLGFDQVWKPVRCAISVYSRLLQSLCTHNHLLPPQFAFSIHPRDLYFLGGSGEARRCTLFKYCCTMIFTMASLGCCLCFLFFELQVTAVCERLQLEFCLPLPFAHKNVGFVLWLAESTGVSSPMSPSIEV